MSSIQLNQATLTPLSDACLVTHLVLAGQSILVPQAKTSAPAGNPSLGYNLHRPSKGSESSGANNERENEARAFSCVQSGTVGKSDRCSPRALQQVQGHQLSSQVEKAHVK